MFKSAEIVPSEVWTSRISISRFYWQTYLQMIRQLSIVLCLNLQHRISNDDFSTHLSIPPPYQTFSVV